MVKKRTIQRTRVTNTALRDIVNNNHIDTTDRLARIETTLKELSGLTPKVEKLEAHRNWLAGAIAVISLVFTTIIAHLKGH